MRKEKVKNVRLILVMGIALILRLVNLNQSFWLDEAISALVAQKPFPYQWAGISGDFQPPLYYLLLHFFMKLEGSSEWFLRIPSVIFGLLTIIVVYKFTTELFNRKVAMVASLMLATSQFHIYYSQELRMYSLVGLLATSAMWCFYKKRWFYTTLFNVIGLYTNYMFVLILISQVIWLILKEKKDVHTVKRWFMSLSLTAVFYLPWFPNLLKQWEASRNLTIALPLWNGLSSLPFWKLPIQIFLKFTLGRIDFYDKYFYASVLGVLLILYGYIVWNLQNKINREKSFVLNWFFTPLIACMFLSFLIPISGVWRLIFLLMPFTILISVALNSMKRLRLFLILIVTVNLFAIFLYWTNSQYQRENWKEAVSYLEKRKAPIVFTVEDGFAPYQWYKKTDQIVCGPITLNKCLTGNNLTYVSYLEDLFDSKKIIEGEIWQNGFTVSNVNNFLGVGFIYGYDKK